MAHSFEAPMALTSVAPDVSASLAAVVHACLEKAPSARPAMADVAASLERERGETSALVVSRSLLRTLSDDASHTRPRLGTEAVTRDARGPAVEDAM
jgi:hypothetical protein